MRGRITHATSRSFETSLAYLHGRIEHEIETFADRLSVSPLELATRLGALLSGAGEWAGHQLPGVPLAAGGRWSGDPGSPPLEVAIQSHGGEASHQTGAPAGALSRKGKKISAAHKKMWGKLTAQERAAKMLAKYEGVKHPTPTQKKAIATLRAKLGGKMPLSLGRKVHPEKQRLYVARNQARKHGLPLPPLPKEKESKESKQERRKRLNRENHQARRDAQKRAAGKYKATSRMAAAAQSAWSGMTFAQRQAEMKRRREVAKKNKAKKAASEAKVVWNKPGKKQSHVNSGAHPEVRPQTEAATGT